MSIALWVIAGAIVGWIGFAHFGLNEARGRLASIVIGIVGGVLGGKLLAPMFAAPAALPDDFSAASLFFAAGAAVAVLAAGNFVENRWGV